MKLARLSLARPKTLPTMLALPLLAAAAWTPAAHAETLTLQQLSQRNNCTACHLIDKRKYGPHFKEVAAKYASDANAVTTLAAKIKAGGSGVWGEDPMPPQPHVSDKDARSMAELIMALKP